ASRKLGRPVKWVATRTESLLGDNHGRDQLISAEMALDENAKILALRAQALHAVGAYVTNAGVVPVLCALRNIPNVYVVPAMLVMSKATFTHTTPLGPYRGAGRPEASYVIERLMEEAARKLNMDPVVFNESMEVRFDPSGTVTIGAGTHSHGQGHATTYAQLASDWLGVPFESIRLVQGDTDAISFGRGTYASRSAMLGGSALRAA